jgi:hypothetical protein
MDDLCRQLFGRPWEALDLEAVEAFLATAREGGVSWQTLGDGSGSEEMSRQVSAFANSERGGYLLLGVDGGDGDGWRVSGVPFVGEGPALWVDGVLGSGLRPRPDYATRTFALADDRQLVVVQVPPVAEPPCATVDGAVLERVSDGVTAVGDPARLAELHARGERARRAAAAGAEALAYELFERAIPADRPFRLALALRATAHLLELDRRLFSTSFDDAMRHVLADQLGASDAPVLAYAQDRVSASLAAPLGGEGELEWLVQALRTGGVGAAVSAREERSAPRRVVDLVARVVQPAWRVAMDLNDELGGGGTFHLFLSVAGGERLEDGSLARPVRLRRTVAWGYPGRDELAGVRRELARAAGRRTHEPR